jgi:hypothetical protein
MAAFMPGASPPLVKTAILFIWTFVKQVGAPMAPKPRKVGEMNANPPQFRSNALPAAIIFFLCFP